MATFGSSSPDAAPHRCGRAACGHWSTASSRSCCRRTCWRAGSTPTQVGAVITARCSGRPPHADDRVAGRALRPGAPAAAHGGADDRDRAGVRHGRRVRVRSSWWPRSARSTPRSEMSAPSSRSSRRCSLTRCRPIDARTCSPATAWLHRWPVPSVHWRQPCPSGRPTTPRSPSLDAERGVFAALRVGGVRAAHVLSAPRAATDARRGGAGPQRARSLEGDRAAAVRSVQRRRLRRRLRGPVDPRAVVGAPPRPLDRHRRRRVLLEWSADGELGAARTQDRGPDRTGPHDGVHAHPGQRAC